MKFLQQIAQLAEDLEKARKDLQDEHFYIQSSPVASFRGLGVLQYVSTKMIIRQNDRSSPFWLSPKTKTKMIAKMIVRQNDRSPKLSPIIRETNVFQSETLETAQNCSILSKF